MIDDVDFCRIYKEDERQYVITILGYYPQCLDCRHYQGNYACPAFPRGIPGDIFSNRVKHDSVQEGQAADIVFELLERCPDEAEEAS